MESTYKRRKFDTLLEIFMAETIGTGLLMYFGCMGSMSSLTKFESPPSMQGGLMFGFVVSSLCVGLGHISKAHLNPSVTLCAFFLGLINTSTAIVYVVAETIGALLGFYFLQLSIPDALSAHMIDSECGFCVTKLDKSVSVQQGFLIEFIATSFLIFVVCSVWDPRNTNTCDSVALKFGLLISALSICAGPFTGASMNPVRTLAPAIVNNEWDNHWLYWIAPLSGSAVSTSFYKYVFMRSLNTSTSAKLDGLNLLDSLKEREALHDDASEEKSLNIA